MSFAWAANIVLDYFPLFVFHKVVNLEEYLSQKSVSLSNMAGPRMHKWKFNGNSADWVTMTNMHVMP